MKHCILSDFGMNKVDPIETISLLFIGTTYKAVFFALLSSIEFFVLNENQNQMKVISKLQFYLRNSFKISNCMNKSRKMVFATGDKTYVS